MKYHLYTHDQRRGTWMTAQYEETISEAIIWGIAMIAKGKLDNFTLCAEDRAGQFSFIPGEHYNASGDEWFLEYAEAHGLTHVIEYYAAINAGAAWRILEDQDEDEWEKCENSSLDYVREYEPSTTELFPKFVLVAYTAFAEEKFHPYEWLHFEGSYTGIDDEPNTEEEIRGWKAERDAFVSRCEKLMDEA